MCKAVQEALDLRMRFQETGLKVDTELIIKVDNKLVSFIKILVNIYVLNTQTTVIYLYVIRFNSG